MDRQVVSRFFLGANSPGGFKSLYDNFTDPSVDCLRILKGGPGCGKSTFMKRVGAAAEERGLSVEYIHCSGDPDSLDGVYIPALRLAYADGTSPHVIEPSFAGSEASYINFGAFYDLDMLRREREGIRLLTEGYKAQYNRAFRLLTGVSALAGGVTLSQESVLRAASRARALIRAQIRGEGSGGRSEKRFLSAYTCLGPMTLWDTVPQLAEKVFVLDNELGLGQLVAEAAAAEAESRGYGVIRCQSPLFPEKTEHVLIPELDTAFVTSSSRDAYPGGYARRLRLDSIPGREELAALRPGLKRRARLSAAVTQEAVEALREAKALHDELEKLYIPAVDFAGIDRLTQRCISAL